MARCPPVPLGGRAASHGPAGDPKPTAQGQVGAVLGLIRTIPSTPAGYTAGRGLQLGPSWPAWGQMSEQCVIPVLNLRPYTEGAWDPAWWGPNFLWSAPGGGRPMSPAGSTCEHGPRFHRADAQGAELPGTISLLSPPLNASADSVF